MTSDEIIEELQKIVYQSNGLHKRLVPEDKENLHDFGKVQKLESRLGEVVKENETLIDELQDKKYEVYNLKNKNLAANEIYNDTQNILGQKLSHMMRQMGNNKNEITAIQNLVEKTMSEFKTQLGSESESDVWNFQPSIQKSESYQPLTSRQYLKKSQSNSSESIGTPKSIQGGYLNTLDQQFINAKSKIYQKSVRNSQNMTMKSITNKSNNTKSAKKMNKSSLSKHSVGNKPKKSKYLNSKKGSEQMNIVPLNAYVPEIIKNEMRHAHK